jgi:uncharacterized protein YndB with AHSA1/START domain
MATRNLVHQEQFPATVERLFGLLITPSAIRVWWEAARAVVIAQPDGIWTAAWGASEDMPDYTTAAVLSTYDPPRRLVMSQQRYQTKFGQLPFQADFVTTFEIEPHPQGAVLQAIQDGFPADAIADSFYAACAKGWRDTFGNIRRYIADQEKLE